MEGRLRVAGALRRKVDADGPGLGGVERMDERVLEAAVEREDHAVRRPQLSDRPAGHRLLEVPLVGDDRVAHRPGGQIDDANLVSADLAGQVLHDVESSAVRRDRVVVVPTAELDDPGRALERHDAQDGEPAYRPRLC